MVLPRARVLGAIVCVLWTVASVSSLARPARAAGMGDVDDAEEEAHPWEKEDLQQHLKDERLFDAVVANDRDLVRVSLKIGAHHHHHKNGYTPLHMAAWLDHPDICDMLIAAGAHLEQKDKYGRTALTIASILEKNPEWKAAIEEDISNNIWDPSHIPDKIKDSIGPPADKEAIAA